MPNKLFIAAMIIMDLIISYPSKSQEHEHGVNVPNWYDQDCCNLHDCRPVENNTINFNVDELNNPIVVYTDNKIIDDKGNKLKLNYEKSRWRRSKDERYHACFRGQAVYCVYLPTGA